MSKGLMVRWCGMRLDGKYMTTSGMPFKGRLEVRGKHSARVLMVTKHENEELIKQRKWLEVELNFEARDLQVLVGNYWYLIEAVEVGNE